MPTFKGFRKSMLRISSEGGSVVQEVHKCEKAFIKGLKIGKEESVSRGFGGR